MDALTAFLTGGLSAVAVYALAQGKPPPTPTEVWKTLEETKPLLTKTFTLDITQARNNQEFIVVGSRVFISNPENPSVPVYIRFNEQRTEPLDLTRHRSIQVPFYRFFITNAIGTGTLTIIVNKFEAVALSESTTNIRVTASGIMLPVDIQAQFITLDVNARNWGGTALTGRDISLDLARLDVALSTRATEATVASLLARLDVALSTRATEVTLASLLARLDVALSTRASEATLASILAGLAATLDVPLSSLADPEISQPVPENLKHVPHGFYTVGGVYKPLAVDVNGALLVSNIGGVISLTFIIDGSGVAITTGEKGHLEIPFACTITGWTLIADQSGNIVIDVWKDTYANFPPTVADTITGTEKPTLAAAQKNQDLTLTTWTTTVNAGDILAFNVDSADTVQRVTLSIRVVKI